MRSRTHIRAVGCVVTASVAVAASHLGERQAHAYPVSQKTLDRIATDFRKSVKFSAKYWRVSEGWLLSCARSEGGVTNRWIAGRSGDWGPLQYLRGTYSGFSRNARDAGLDRGTWLPKRLFWSRKNQRLSGRNDTLFGQAFATGWAFRSGHSSHWYGRGC